jgi:hypothetical protein
MLTRRRFLGAAAVTLGLAGLRSAFGYDDRYLARGDDRYGALIRDPAGILALPAGFSYRIFSRAGEVMDDGFVVPGLHDGMAAFAAPGGHTLLVRNHEVGWDAPGAKGPFGPAYELLDHLDPSRIFDPGDERSRPALGGTTTLLYDTARQRLVGHRLSLAGTLRNCAGGPTPWGSWLTCEETVARTGDGRLRDHGWVFEVPAVWGDPPVRPIALRAMGRFNHEAVAVDGGSGALFLTEDRDDGLFYRFLPDEPGNLVAGGRLQALAVVERPSLDTRNWRWPRLPTGQALAVRWIDLDDVESPEDDLRYRGFAAGAARFARGEGIWAGDDGIYMACTNGGSERLGQIWRYRPSPAEGRRGEEGAPARIELFVEPNDSTLVENADNLTVAPWGDLVVCEDGTGDDYLVGVTPEGALYRLAHSMSSTGEFAGACFSPDGSTLFVNMQTRGWTLGIRGPWHRHGLPLATGNR